VDPYPYEDLAMDSLLTFFQTQLDRILVSLKPTKPSHSLGPKKPSLGQQEAKLG
jgi:hypothetical protein